MPSVVVKQLSELTANDLNAHPVWELLVNPEKEFDPDDLSVKPFQYANDEKTLEGRLLICKAEFTAKDGSRWTGYISPPDVTGLSSIQPVIVSPKGQVELWFGFFIPTQAQLKESYNRLGKEPGELFPLRTFSIATK